MRPFVASLLVLLFAPSLCAQTDFDFQKGLHDVVMTAFVDGGTAILMATVARPSVSRKFFRLEPAPPWRFRLLRVRSDTRAKSFSLSADGTKAVVSLRDLEDGQPEIVDLAQLVLEIPQRRADAPPRYLGEWLIHPPPDGPLIVIKDDADKLQRRATAEVSDCLNGLTSVAHVQSGDVWGMSEDGTVCRGRLNANGGLELSPQQPLAGAGFRIVNRRSDALAVGLDAGQFVVVDLATRAMTPLPDVKSSTEALLLAIGGVPGESRAIDRNAAARFARELDAQAVAYLRERYFADRTVGTWAAWTLLANPELYVPALEFAENEPILPASVDVWDLINPEPAFSNLPSLSWHQRTTIEIDAYRRLDPHLKKCSIYTATRSYAGSWLHEYWTYYPFDVGQGSHFHDTEHVFVEVDKLGGTVHQIIGAAHGIWAANNIYRANTANVAPVTLPLFSIAEFGKHASAPDINRDLKFTIGVDVNTFRDREKIWGIRDTTAVTDAHLRGYDGTMVVDRRPEDVWYPSLFDARFPDGRLPTTRKSTAAGRACTLMAFPTVQPCTDRQWKVLKGQYGPSAPCAAAILNNDGDYKRPEQALKRAFAPLHTLRYSVGRRPQIQADGTQGRRQYLHSIGGVGEISWMKFIPEPMRAPGRLSLDLVLPLDFNRFEGVQARYERLSTNLAGFYFGVSVMRYPPREGDTDSWFGGRYRPWLDVGTIFEYAPIRYLNIGAQTGLSYTNGAGIGFEFRVVTAILRPGTYGIDKKTRSPY